MKPNLLDRVVVTLFAILCVLAFAGFLAAQDPKPLPTGAKPTPAHLLLSAPRFVGLQSTALEKVAYVPRLHVWGNNRYGVCVSSEEAFNQGACGKFIEESVVIEFARKHGWLNGAYLTEVMDEMQRTGFPQDGKRYSIGRYSAVNYANEGELKSALSIAPVKIAMASGSLPSGAGKANGWYALGGRNRNTDHCVAICGYGPAKWLCEKLNVAKPAALKDDQPLYLLFTWGTIGLVDHAWIMGTCVEAWVRDPAQIIDGKPSPNPGPPQPTPPDPPQPGPNPPTPDPVSPTEFKFDPTLKRAHFPADWTITGGKKAADTLDVSGLSPEVLAAIKLLIEANRKKAKPKQEEFPQSKLPTDKDAREKDRLSDSLLASGMLAVIHEGGQSDLSGRWQSYETARNTLPADGWLITFVGRNPEFNLPGAVSCRANALPGHAVGTVVLSGPWQGRHVFYGALDAPTRDQVEAALRLAKAEFNSTKVRESMRPAANNCPT